MAAGVVDRREELLSLAERAVAYGSKMVDQIEVLVQDDYDISCVVQLGQMNKAAKVQEAGASVRCVVDQRVGSAFTNRLDWASLERAVERAVASAKASTKEEKWPGLPTKKPYGKLEGAWDSDIPSREVGEFVDFTVEMSRRAAQRGEGIIVGEAGTGIIYGWVAYANSNGLSSADRGTAAYTYLTLVAPSPAGMTPMVFDFDVKRRYDLDMDRVVEATVRDVLLAKKTARAETGPSTVILTAYALKELLTFTLVPALKGENVARGKSVLAGRRGEHIASKGLSLTDDGLFPGAMNSSLFDGEGVPHQKTPLIVNGRLESFLWDTYWAGRQGETSTGNASRNLRTGVVTIQPTNLVISPGGESLEDIISGVKSGYLIKAFQGAHSSNQETGDFSVVGNPAFRIQDGELTGCCHGLMLAGNIFDLIQHFDRAANDVRDYMGIVAPSTLFTDVQIVAKEE